MVEKYKVIIIASHFPPLIYTFRFSALYLQLTNILRSQEGYYDLIMWFSAWGVFELGNQDRKA